MKKITILCLHLGYGGIEVATTNLANMLSDDYDVEIISFYNIYGKPFYKLNDNIKVKYLYEGGPNKNEFKEALKRFNIFKIIKEGFKSLSILIKKRKLMIKEIKNCKSDLIISTRHEITQLLSNHYKGNAITISQEHSHHDNNQKYINTIVKSLKNIDYFMPVSKKMTEFYKKRVKGNTKVMYGPLCVDYIPDKESKKNNKNIISIGRLSPEKGYLDLIDVFNLIIKEDNKCTLSIIGDGEEFNLLEEKIKKLKLDKYITLYGKREKDFIRNKLNESSVYLMTSFKESFGLVLLEAGAFGIPSICFDSAEGAKEIITDDVDGFLIKNRNKKEMAKKTLELLNNKNKLANMGHNARIKTEEYSYEVVKNKWLGIILKMLQ